ncbi:MAG: SPOR domain-containing protein [Ferruginibacter sp.]
MKKIFLFTWMNITLSAACAQPGDSAIKPTIKVSKDDRIDMLGKKMAEYNESLALKIRMERGYRLTLLNTIDRTLAIQVRSKLLQQFPDQNVYMTFQSPYIKLKFGDFLEREDADKMRKQIIESRIIPGNIYIVPEMVEVKPDKSKVPVSTDE